MRLREGDKVKVITGKDAGKESRVVRVMPKTGKLIVEGVNTAKKHQAPRGQTMQGGIIDKDMPIHVSNIALFNPATQKADRVGFKQLQDGRKVRVFKSNGEQVDA